MRVALNVDATLVFDVLDVLGIWFILSAGVRSVGVLRKGLAVALYGFSKDS